MALIIGLLRGAGAPPFFSKPVMELLSDRPPIPPVVFPDPAFAGAITDKDGRRMPQAIAHRGYKARWPENSMLAFREAVKAGAHAVETDVHLTRDNVVVLSHDASLKRCFGVDKKLADCDWEYVKNLRTTAEPHEPMPRLEDLLRYMEEEPEAQRLWVLLDIKIDNDAESIMQYMSEVVSSVPPAKGRLWENRILLGCWAAKYIPLSHKYFAGFSVANIGFSVPYSAQFLAVPNVAFNMLQASLVSPSGRWFIHRIKKRKRRVLSWTVNDSKNMDWCIRKGIDGVISDDPAMFLEACRGFREDEKPAWPVGIVVRTVQINMFAFMFGILFWYRHGFGLERKYLVDKSK